MTRQRFSPPDCLFTVWLLGAGIVGSSGVPLASAKDVNAVFAESRQTARLIQSIEFEQTFELKQRIHHAKFVAKKGLFLVETTLDKRTGQATADEIQAFNGAKYQRLLEKIKTLGVSSMPPNHKSEMGVLTWPFFWLHEPKQGISFSEIREAAAWDRTVKLSRLVGEETVSGVRYEIVEVKHPDRTFKVFFSPAHGYYPMQWESVLPDGSLAGSIRVAAWETQQVDGALAIVPTRMLYDETGLDKVSLAKSRVFQLTPGTLRVNHEIDDDVFTISPTRAERVLDLDARRKEQAQVAPQRERPVELSATQSTDGKPPVTTQNAPGTSRTLYISLALAAVALGAGVLAWYVRRP